MRGYGLDSHLKKDTPKVSIPLPYLSRNRTQNHTKIHKGKHAANEPPNARSRR